MKDIVLSELVNPAKLAEFCAKWKIVEFALFGSVLRDDFGPDSDIDVLVISEQPLSLPTKQQLGQLHLQLSKQCGSWLRE